MCNRERSSTKRILKETNIVTSAVNRQGSEPSSTQDVDDDCSNDHRADDHPLSIAGRIMEYLARTNTHKMYRNVMRKYVLDVVCKREIVPFLREITASRV